MAYQSPAKPLVAALGAAVESPVGMPFSEKERAGKILPCHKVSNDGLMRISPETMDRFLEGSYDESISHKVIVDCRFGYEFDGGHIRAAINIQDKKAVDSMLLKGEIFARGQSDVPLPSESGKADSAGRRKKVVVVFHCEYSAMRAPTV
jgi:M-phase inducer tyrosine phosphatase